MKKQFNRIEKLKIWILWPFVINVIIALVVAIGSNIFNAKSAFLGGLVAILPQSILGYCSFKYWGALQSKQIWQGFVKGEALKFGFTAILFALVYIFLLINTMWFLLAFIMMQFAGILVSCRLLKLG